MSPVHSAICPPVGSWGFLLLKIRGMRGLRYHSAMKPLPVPLVPGKTESERFDNAVRKTFTVSKEEIARREAEWQKAKGKKTQPK